MFQESSYQKLEKETKRRQVKVGVGRRTIDQKKEEQYFVCPGDGVGMLLVNESWMGGPGGRLPVC